jgi:hypothetical protein
MQSTPPAPTQSAPRPARKRWRNTKTPPQANASKENSEAAAAKKHKTVTAAKRYGDALAIQEACIQAKRESRSPTVSSAKPGPRFAPNAAASLTGTANLPYDLLRLQRLRQRLRRWQPRPRERQRHAYAHEINDGRSGY